MAGFGATGCALWTGFPREGVVPGHMLVEPGRQPVSATWLILPSPCLFDRQVEGRDGI